MVPAVTRSANSSLAEAYSEFSARASQAGTSSSDTEFVRRETNVNKTCHEAVG
jgi:hypothetical protein